MARMGKRQNGRVYYTLQRKLTKILKQGKMNKDLKDAVKAISTAVKKGDIPLAADLSGVKSYVCNEITACTFSEDSKYNERKLGNTVYGLLDGIHHDLAFATGTIPSGVTILTAKARHERKTPTGEHPVLRKIRKEHDDIWRKVRARK